MITTQKPGLVPLTEAVTILRAGIHRALPVTVPPQDEWGAYPYFEFRIGDWIYSVFVDAGDFDYIENVTSPDGRIGEFNDWERSPEDHLTNEERAALLQMIGAQDELPNIQRNPG